MICKVCQKEIPDGARFCPECGSRTQNINCINCGAEITPEVKFCPGCGRPISSPSNNSTYSGSYNSYQSSPVQPNLYSDPGYTPKKKKPTNSKVYNRNKARDWKREYHEPISGFSYILPCIFRYCSMICAVCSAPMEVSTSRSYCLRSPHSWPEILR